MLEKSFLKWALLKEESDFIDPFTKMDQKKNDVVYFGIHDIYKYYKENSVLPKLTMSQIDQKMGIVTSVDPIDQIVIVSVEKPPHLYGYRKLENDKEKSKRFMNDDKKYEVRISISNLQNISHLVENSNENIWLVVDGGTKYQKNLIREIRKREFNKSREQEDFDLSDDFDDEIELSHFNPTIKSKSNHWKRYNETQIYKKY